MKKCFAVFTMIVAMLGTSALAHADPMQYQGHGGGPGGGGHGGPQGQGGYGPHGGPGGGGYGPHGGPGGGGYGPHGGPGYPYGGPAIGWHHGNRIPPAYFRDPGYWVNNWRAYDLPPPPFGQRWIYVNGNYFLTAVATGIIFDILTHPHP